MTKPAQHVAVRLDEATIARVEALVPHITSGRHEATRSDVMRLLITDGLVRVERDPRLLRAMMANSC